jgi:transcriptional regulator with XRE-family HTH domain
MTAAPPPDESSATVGKTIAGMRRRAGLTGHQLGKMVQMSQAKISRIETGQSSVSPADAARLARALGASSDAVDHVVAMAQRTHDEMTDWRQSSGVAGGIQAQASELEAEAQVIRIFQPNVIVGLAQTAEYATGILNAFAEIFQSPDEESRPASVARAVTARIGRQEILIRPDREFHFLMGEAALTGRLVSPIEMLAQIEHLGRLAKRANIELRFIPADVRLMLPMPMLNGFELLDDTAVFVDLFNTAMISRGVKDVAQYRGVFDRLEQTASASEPILKKYRGIYLAELTRDAEAAG